MLGGDPKDRRVFLDNGGAEELRDYIEARANKTDGLLRKPQGGKAARGRAGRGAQRLRNRQAGGGAGWGGEGVDA
jgi:hypothetical protein